MKDVIRVLRNIMAMIIVAGCNLVLLTFVFSYITVTDQMARMLSVMNYGICCLLGGFLASAQWKHKLWFWNTCVNGGFLCLLIAAKMIITDEVRVEVILLIRSILIGIAGAVIGDFFQHFFRKNQ